MNTQTDSYPTLALQSARDYITVEGEVAVCDVCGCDEHSPAELADCIDSALAPTVTPADPATVRAMFTGFGWSVTEPS